MSSLFPQGLRGLSDSRWSGIQGSVSKQVGVDIHSKPGLIKVHQKLSKDSGTTIDELCKVGVLCSDDSTLWFSSESGKIWRESDGDWSLALNFDSFSNYTEATPILETSFSASVKYAYSRCLILPSDADTIPTYIGGGKWSATSSYSSISYAFTIPDDEDMLVLVSCGYFESSTVTIDSVTVGGVSAELVSVTGSIDPPHKQATYQLVNPTPGSAEVVCTFSGNVTNRFMYVSFFKGVRQIEPLGRYTTSLSTASSVEIDLNATANNQLRYGFVLSEPATHTHGTGIVEMESGAVGSAGNVSTFYKPFEVGTNIILSAIEFEDFIYFANNNVLWKISTDDLSDWTGNVENVGNFENFSNCHPMVVQNLKLLIGDDIDIAIVEDDIFYPTSRFTIKSPETIQAFVSFDTDILIGTKDVNKGRVLRWDTEATSWIAEDEIDENGVNAFIKDDNYVYISAGDYGRLYFYNGEKMELFKRIPGDWSPTKRAIINPNAVGFLLGIPVFGLSNVAGNPTEQGVYSFGSYSKNYPKVLDLSYPVSSDEFSGVEIGAIVVNGSDMYVAWKSATDAGVDKLDWSNKYESAYIETMQLTSPQDRSRLKTFKRVIANYTSLPADTSISIGVKSNYEDDFTDLSVKTDTKLSQVISRETIPEVSSLQLRFDFGVKNNDAPEVEDLSVE